jgi:hypothetical protein
LEEGFENEAQTTHAVPMATVGGTPAWRHMGNGDAGEVPTVPKDASKQNTQLAAPAALPRC